MELRGWPWKARSAKPRGIPAGLFHCRLAREKSWQLPRRRRVWWDRLRWRVPTPWFDSKHRPALDKLRRDRTSSARSADRVVQRRGRVQWRPRGLWRLARSSAPHDCGSLHYQGQDEPRAPDLTVQIYLPERTQQTACRQGAHRGGTARL